MSDPGLSVANITSQLQDTRARVVVVAPEAAPRYLEANAQLPEEQRVRHILVLGAGSPPPGCSPFRDLYEDDGAACPKQLPGYSQSIWWRFKIILYLDMEPDETMVILWTSGTTVRLLLIISNKLCNEEAL